MSTPVIAYSGNAENAENAENAGYAAFASMADIANQTFAGFERLARLNLQTVKTMLAEQHGIALEAIDSRSLGWVLTLPTAQAQAGFKKTLAYWQHVNEIAVETATQNAGASWEGFRACTQWLAAAVSDAARARARPSLLLAASDAASSVSAAIESATESATESASSATAKPGGKKRSVDIVDGAGNVVSSVKQ